MNGDINNRIDVERFVNNFYRKALVDDMLASSFKRVDWTTYLSAMYSCWFAILIKEDYASLNNLISTRISVIKNYQLDRWKKLYCDTVDENFTGLQAEIAKTHASRIMNISGFYGKF